MTFKNMKQQPQIWQGLKLITNLYKSRNSSNSTNGTCFLCALDHIVTDATRDSVYVFDDTCTHISKNHNGNAVASFYKAAMQQGRN